MNKFLAHHINPNAGAGVNNPFAERPIESIVDGVMSGEIPKEYLGDDADRIIREVNERRSQTKINPTNFKMPGEFPGTLEEFNQKYGEKNEMDNRPTYMEIPVIPFPQEPKFNQESRMNRYEQTERDMAPQAPIERRQAPREDDLAFLKAYTKSRMA
tara:strand:- start:188 stop:658 length:471 start_codon:yes stop_codon:yes gene_type:complete